MAGIKHTVCAAAATAELLCNTGRCHSHITGLRQADLVPALQGQTDKGLREAGNVQGHNVSSHSKLHYCNYSI